MTRMFRAASRACRRPHDQRRPAPCAPSHCFTGCCCGRTERGLLRPSRSTRSRTNGCDEAPECRAPDQGGMPRPLRALANVASLAFDGRAVWFHSGQYAVARSPDLTTTSKRWCRRSLRRAALGADRVRLSTTTTGTCGPGRQMPAASRFTRRVRAPADRAPCRTPTPICLALKRHARVLPPDLDVLGVSLVRGRPTSTYVAARRCVGWKYEKARPSSAWGTRRRAGFDRLRVVDRANGAPVW
mgnify:CR=1 FL=1